MENIQNNTNKFVEEESLNLRELFDRCLIRWWWFALSIGVAVCLAFLYVKTTPKTFSRQATVVVNANEKGKSMGGMEELMDLGMISSRVNVENEIVSFTSPATTWEVVKRLELNKNYYTKGFLTRKDELYGSNLPVRVELLDVMENQSVSFSINFSMDSMHVLLKDFIFSSGGITQEFNVEAEGQLNDTLKTPVGRVIVRTTAHYSPKWEKTIYFSKGTLHGIVTAYNSRIKVALTGKKSTAKWDKM